MFCLDSVLIQHQNDFYKQRSGIVTGDNNSVSLANIAVHYLTKPIATTLQKCEIYKRFIDDIIFLAYDSILVENITVALTTAFAKYNLTLKFRKCSTSDQNGEVEFLDLLHVIDPSTHVGFITTAFTKPTALGCRFINGRSHHPPHVFKSIVYGEAIRLRRLNETEHRYHKDLEKLETKCIDSGFNKAMVRDMIQQAFTWENRLTPPIQHERNKDRTIWASSFYNLMKLTAREKELKPTSTIVYKKPQTLASHLTNYKRIAHNVDGKECGTSFPCGKCALCGKHGKHESMVAPTNTIRTPKGQEFKLRQNLCCKDNGIYVATCSICSHQYVGQTKNKFSTRWNSHRHFWNKHISIKKLDTSKDDSALLSHFNKNHSNYISEKPSLSNCFKVTFVEKPSTDRLDTAESFWISKLEASINLQNTFMPKIK